MPSVTLEEFLKPFSSALGRTTPPESVEKLDTENSCQYILSNALSEEEIIKKFFEETAKIGVEVTKTSANELAQTLVEVAKTLGGEKVILANNEAVLANNIEDAFQKEGFTTRIWDNTQGHSEIFKAQESDIGITFAYGAIAETGSVIQITSEGSGRSLCTIPTSHIAVVKRSSVFARMGDALCTLGKEYEGNMPSNITIISGPSATADIELVRVVGVHGPVKTAIVFIED